MTYTILVADDSSYVRFQVIMILDYIEKYACTHAESLDKAVTKLQEKEFDLIFVDSDFGSISQVEELESFLFSISPKTQVVTMVSPTRAKKNNINKHEFVLFKPITLENVKKVLNNYKNNITNIQETSGEDLV